MLHVSAESSRGTYCKPVSAYLTSDKVEVRCFDIATGLFGDPARGATGSTVVGTGALRIRDSLSPGAQAGFNDSVRYHLGRKY